MSYGYGDQQAQWTMNRAAYGDTAATMMASGGGYGGGDGGFAGNPLGMIGAQVRPLIYSPPARVNVGFYGMYQQNPSFLNGLLNTTGFGSTPQSMFAAEYIANSTADFGGKIGGFASGAGLAIAGSAVGYGLGGMFGGGIIAGLGGSLVGMSVAQQFQKAYSQRQEMQNFLEQSSYRFVGPGSGMEDPRFGMGFSRSARREITDFIRSQDTKDSYLNFSDMSNILKGSTNLGLFNGTQSMDDFKRKFTEITDAVKYVTKTLHQTLDESLKTIRELKQIGIDPSQVKGTMFNVDTYAKMAGKTGAEMFGLGIQGAEVFRGTGVNMGIGFQATMMNNAAIRAARDAGTLSQEAIMQAGGEEALAMRLTTGGLAFAQSASGRGFNAAFYNGGFDASKFMGQMYGGGGNFINTVTGAAGNLGSPSRLLEYQAFQAKHTSDMGKSFGGMGLEMGKLGFAAGYGNFLADTTGASNEAGFRVALQSQGVSEPDIEAYIAKLKSAGRGFDAANASAMQTYDKKKIEAAQQTFVFNRAWTATKDFTNKNLVDPVVRPLSKMTDDMAQWAQDTGLAMYGGVVMVSDKGLDKMVGVGGGRAREGIIEMDDMIGGFKGVVSDLLNKTPGEELSRAYKAMGIKTKRMHISEYNKLKNSAEAEDYAHIMSMEGGSYHEVISKKDLYEISEKSRVVYNALANAKDIDTTSIKLKQGARDIDFTKVKNIRDLATAALGKTVNDVRDLSSEEAAALKKEFGKSYWGNNILEEGAKDIGSVADSGRTAEQSRLKKAVDSIDSIRTALGEAATIINGDGNAVMGYARKNPGQLDHETFAAVMKGDRASIMESLAKNKGITNASDAAKMADKLLSQKKLISEGQQYANLATGIQANYSQTEWAQGFKVEAVMAGAKSIDAQNAAIDVQKRLDIFDIEGADNSIKGKMRDTAYAKRVHDIRGFVDEVKKASTVEDRIKILNKRDEFKSLAAQVTEGNTKEIIEKIIGQTAKNISAGGAIGANAREGMDASQGNAIENLSTQLRINQQILVALTAIANTARLK